jgi:hypothetical protein
MGGPGRPNTTTPEHLFAVGYAPCFGGALDFVGVQKKKNAKGASITCSVSSGPREICRWRAHGDDQVNVSTGEQRLDVFDERLLIRGLLSVVAKRGLNEIYRLWGLLDQFRAEACRHVTPGRVGVTERVQQQHSPWLRRRGVLGRIRSLQANCKHRRHRTLSLRRDLTVLVIGLWDSVAVSMVAAQPGFQRPPQSICPSSWDRFGSESRMAFTLQRARPCHRYGRAVADGAQVVILPSRQPALSPDAAAHAGADGRRIVSDTPGAMRPDRELRAPEQGHRIPSGTRLFCGCRVFKLRRTTRRELIQVKTALDAVLHLRSVCAPAQFMSLLLAVMRYGAAR